MGSIVKGIFGGSESEQQSRSTSTSESQRIGEDTSQGFQGSYNRSFLEDGTVDLGPWKPQQDALRMVFDNAQQLYRNQQNPTQVAGLTQDAVGAYDRLTNQLFPGTSNAIQTQTQEFANNANQAVNNSLSLYDQDLASNAIQNAGQFANNPYLQETISNIEDTVNRNLNENVLPKISLATSATGNANSTRAGIAEGIAARGAIEEASRRTSDLLTQNYDQALNRGISTAQNNFQNALSANQQFLGGAGSSTNQIINNLLQNLNVNQQAPETMVRGGQIEQGVIDRDRNYQWSLLNNLLGASQGSYGQFGTKPMTLQDAASLGYDTSYGYDLASSKSESNSTSSGSSDNYGDGLIGNAVGLAGLFM